MVKTQPFCPVTVFVDSQVSNRCHWATCFYKMSRKLGFHLKFQTKFVMVINMEGIAFIVFFIGTLYDFM